MGLNTVIIIYFGCLILFGQQLLIASKFYFEKSCYEPNFELDRHSKSKQLSLATQAQV